VNILISGASGFIAQHLISNLRKKGHWILAMSRQKGTQSKGIASIQVDIRNRDAVHSAVKLADRWVNLAGAIGTSELIQDPRLAVETNILGALNFFEASRDYNKPGLQITSGNYWMINSYSITKYAAEKLAMMACKEWSADIRILRTMNVYGPGQVPSSVKKVFPSFAIPALKGEPLVIYGSGNQVTDMVYVKDVAEVLARVLLTDSRSNSSWYMENIRIPDKFFECGAGAITINEAASLIVSLVGSSSEITHVKTRAGEEPGALTAVSKAHMDKLAEFIGFHERDFTPRREAFRTTIDWYRDMGIADA